MEKSFRFPHHFRLRKRDDFRRTFDRKCSVSDEWLIIYGCENDLPYSRIGMSVSRKVGNAIRRNRLRRLYREAFRLAQHDILTGLDLILIPRKREDNPTLAELQQSLPQLIKRVSKRLHKNPR